LFNRAAPRARTAAGIPAAINQTTFWAGEDAAEVFRFCRRLRLVNEVHAFFTLAIPFLECLIRDLASNEELRERATLRLTL
jgi:hypothetical protein